MKRAFTLLACSAACLTAPTIALSGTNFGDYSLGVTRDLGDGLSLGATVSGATRKSQLGGAGDDRLVLSLVKGF